MSHKLFSSSNSHSYLDSQIMKATEEAGTLSKETFEANSQNQIIDHVTSKYRIEKIELLVDEKQHDMIPIKIDVTDNDVYTQTWDNRRIEIPGYKVVEHIPFTGTSELFYLQPSTHTLRSWDGEITGETLSFSRDFQESNATPESITDVINQEISHYQQEIGRVNHDISDFNKRLTDSVSVSVQKRFEQISKFDAIKTALKMPLEKSNNPSPINRVEIKVQKFTTLSDDTKEDPGATISDEHYEAIIDSLRSMGNSMETTFASTSLGEEQLRDILLAGLMSSIKSGFAGSELFHKSGKTDIAIPFNNKATFVAECKLWEGAKYINEGITQLLAYTTWRDAKTALIIFNRDNSNFSAIQDQIEGIFTIRDDFVRKITQRSGEWRFVMQKTDDPTRYIEIHVILLDVHKI